MDLTKLFSDLQAAVADVTTKKSAYQKASEASAEAETSMNNAIAKARALQKQLKDSIGEILPGDASDTRVRQS